MSVVDYFFLQGVDRSHPSPHLTSPSCCVCPCAQVQRLRQALQESQADRDTARLDKELLAQRLQGLEQEAENKKRSQDDRTRQLKGLEVRTLGAGLWWWWGGRGLGPGTGGTSVSKGTRIPQASFSTGDRKRAAHC